MKHRQVQALRARGAVLWKARNAVRVEYLQAELELRTPQGNELACERLPAPLRNPPNTEGPKRPLKRDRSSLNEPKSGAVQPSQSRNRFTTNTRVRGDAYGRDASASSLTVKAADAAAE